MIDPFKIVSIIEKYGDKLWRKRFWFISFNIRLSHRKASKQYSNEILLDYLEYQYKNYQLLKVNGQRYPIVVFLPKDITIIDDSDSNTILSPLSNFNPELKTKHYQYYWAMRSAIPSYDNDTFIFERLTLNPTLNIKASVSKFFKVLLTSYSLEWEILYAAAKKSKNKDFDSQKLIKYLPRRNRLHKINSDPILDGLGRAAGIAISVLLAYKTKNGKIKFILRERGSLSISLRKGMLHVFPSGNFQAPMEEYDTEYNLLHCVLWEYFEEFYDEKEPENRRKPAKWFYSKPPVEELRNMLKNKTATLLYNGIAVDLLNLRPEFLLTLYISDETWIERHETGTDTLFNPNSESGNKVRKIEFISDPELLFKNENINPNGITPPGAAALWAGIKALDKLLK